MSPSSCSELAAANFDDCMAARGKYTGKLNYTVFQKSSTSNSWL